MLKNLDPLIHQPLRLAIMSLLISVESASFGFLLEKTEASKGNLSVQLRKLEEAGYIQIHKSFRNNYPHTECKITPAGVSAFERYVGVISGLLKPDDKDDKS